MSKLPAEAHTILGRVYGIVPDVDWAQENHGVPKIEVCVEFYEGKHMAYVAGLSEDETTVRVDLDVQGWKDLADLAMDVHERMAKVLREELEA